MHSLLPRSLLLTLLNVSIVNAINIPLTVRTNVEPSSRLAKRASVALDNRGNAQYIANITLGGTPVRVLLDTGSSDLWVNYPGAVPSTKPLGKDLKLSYAIGAAQGNIVSTQLKIANYTVDEQAFLLVTDAKSFSTDIHKQGYDGLMGLGPNEGSRIFDEIDSDAGHSVLTNMFEKEAGSDHYITFLLDRKFDPTNDVKGQFTVNEIVPGFERINTAPKLEIQNVHRLLDEEQHWQTLTDKDNGIIGPDGQVIKIDSIVPKSPDGQLVAVFDSGFTFSQVPRQVSDAIYGRVKGAIYDPKKEWWTVPCGQMLNISFNFGGQNIPIHPLDTVDDNFNIQDPTGKKACIGSFQPITSAFSLLGNYDMIMGMNFLRNTYTLHYFGNWFEADKRQGAGDPYMKIVSVTDPKVAKSDFVSLRLQGTDTTTDPQWQLLPAEQQQHSPISDEEKKKKYQEMILSRWPYIFTGCLVFVLLVVGYIVWRCCCRRKKDAAKGLDGKASKFGGLPFARKQDREPSLSDPKTSYLPLKAPLGGASTANLSTSNLSTYKNEDGYQSQHHQPSYGYQQNHGYGGQTPGYGGQTTGYGGQTPGYGGQHPGYGGQYNGYQ